MKINEIIASTINWKTKPVGKKMITTKAIKMINLIDGLVLWTTELLNMYPLIAFFIVLDYFIDYFC